MDDTQVFHVNTTNLELSSEDFDETISCLALRSNALGVSHVLWDTTGNFSDFIPVGVYHGAGICPFDRKFENKLYQQTHQS